VATASMPSGAVASELAKEGKKKTTFLDIDLFSKLQSQRYAMGSARIVTVMSHGCHFLLRGVLRAQFRVTVDFIVTATIFFNRTTLPFHAEFSVAGSRCLLSTNSCDVLRLSAPWQAVKNPPGARTFQMEIVEDPSLACHAPGISHFRGYGHLVFVLLEPKGFFCFDLLRRRVMGTLSPAAARDSYFWNVQLLPIAIGLLGTTMGIAPLHCACLEHNGNGLLLAGHSGSGKSTLTAALARRGFAVVSDGWTYVSHNPGGLVAHGLFAPIKLLPDTIQFFPELRSRTPKRTLNGELALEVDAASLFQSTVRSSVHPEWLVFLERTSLPGCQFVPCRPEHTIQFFERNAEKLPLGLPAAARARSEVIKQLSACQSWILRTGSDPMQTASAIEEFLSRN
jgi:hypothetical protein